MSQFVQFAEVADLIGKVSSKIEKVTTLSHYLSGLSDSDLALASLFFTGNVFAMSSNQKLNVGVGIVRDALKISADIDEDEYKQIFLKYSEPGETAEAILSKLGLEQEDSLSLRDAKDFYDEISEIGSTKTKASKLATLYTRVSPLTAKYITKIMIGDLRIGLKEAMVEDALAQAFFCAEDDDEIKIKKNKKKFVQDVKWANMLTGDIGEVAILVKQDNLSDARLHIFNPIKSMLATAEATADDIHKRMKDSAWYADDKYDGIRAQSHKLGSQIRIFSRDLNDITLQFPDIKEHLEEIDHDFILDGEIVGMDGDTILPFFKLQQRLGRKEVSDEILKQIPARYMVFDLIYLDGKTYLNSEYKIRRKVLEEFIKNNTSIMMSNLIEVSSIEEIKKAFVNSKKRNNEGLVLKDPKSTYKPGKRGISWLKYKETLEPIDAVITGVEFGHGRRREDLSDYTFSIWNRSRSKLITLGKVYSGVADADVRRLTEYFKEITIKDHGRYRDVEPKVVIEVQYESIQKSERNESGFALRFPRITKLRMHDKGIEDIDDLNRVEEIWKKFTNK